MPHGELYLAPALFTFAYTLMPTALSSVPFGVVLVRFRLRVRAYSFQVPGEEILITNHPAISISVKLLY